MHPRADQFYAFLLQSHFYMKWHSSLKHLPRPQVHELTFLFDNSFSEFLFHRDSWEDLGIWSDPLGWILRCIFPAKNFILEANGFSRNSLGFTENWDWIFFFLWISTCFLVTCPCYVEVCGSLLSTAANAWRTKWKRKRSRGWLWTVRISEKNLFWNLSGSLSGSTGM